MSDILKKLKSIVPKYSPLHYANKVNVTKDYIEHTDGFSLIRLKNVNNVPEGYYNKDALNKYIVANVAEPETLDNWPNTDAVLPKEEPIHEVELNGIILEKLLKVLTANKDDKEKRISIQLRANQQPLTVTNSNGDLALIVPSKAR